MKRAYDCIVTVRVTNNQNGATVQKDVTKPVIAESEAEAEAKCRSETFVKQFVGTYLPLDKQKLVTCEVLAVRFK